MIGEICVSRNAQKVMGGGGLVEIFSESYLEVIRVCWQVVLPRSEYEKNVVLSSFFRYSPGGSSVVGESLRSLAF